MHVEAQALEMRVFALLSLVALVSYIQDDLKISDVFRISRVEKPKD